MFAPDGRLPWLHSHAALPTTMPTSDGRFRVFFAGRDERNRAHIGAFEFDPATPDSVSHLTDEPLLSPGALGAFDDAGVTVSCLVDVGDSLLLYYTGWTLGGTVPFHLAVGVAKSDDGGRTFSRVSQAPVMGRHHADPFLIASPSVLREPGGTFRAWYVSATGWEASPEGPRHSYHIRHATSSDGIVWRRDGEVCVDFTSPTEYAFGRPHVVTTPNGYAMFFCQRGEHYRLAFARSTDGLSWERDDDTVALAGAPGGWERQMQAYPWYLDHGGREYLLYNGNDFGRTGIGLAERVRP